MQAPPRKRSARKRRRARAATLASSSAESTADSAGEGLQPPYTRIMISPLVRLSPCSPCSPSPNISLPGRIGGYCVGDQRRTWRGSARQSRDTPWRHRAEVEITHPDAEWTRSLRRSKGRDLHGAKASEGGGQNVEATFDRVDASLDHFRTWTPAARSGHLRARFRSGVALDTEIAWLLDSAIASQFGPRVPEPRRGPRSRRAQGVGDLGESVELTNEANDASTGATSRVCSSSPTPTSSSSRWSRGWRAAAPVAAMTESTLVGELAAVAHSARRSRK